MIAYLVLYWTSRRKDWTANVIEFVHKMLLISRAATGYIRHRITQAGFVRYLQEGCKSPNWFNTKDDFRINVELNAAGAKVIIDSRE
jgi:hypothetical protein